MLSRDDSDWDNYWHGGYRMLRHQLLSWRTSGAGYRHGRYGILSICYDTGKRAFVRDFISLFVELLLEIILKIENIDRSLFTRLELFYIDLFLFSYYTGGMANIDVAYLTWDCVDEEGRLCYERIKFPKKARIKLNNKARGIIDRYKDKCFGNYMLPIFSHKHNTEKKQRGRLKRLCDKVNKALGKLQKIIKYKEKITWYSARGTFITEMIAADIHPIVVAEMAGNSPNTIYKHYFKNTNYQQIDVQVDNVYGCNP